MTLDAAETFIAGTGHVYLGAVGSTAPTNATGTPNAAFSDFGYTTEDGVTFAIATTLDGLSAWQSFYKLRRWVTEVEFTVNLTFLQHNYETLKLWLLGGTATGASPSYKVVPGSPDTILERAAIIDTVDGSKIERWYIPRAVISPNGDVAYNRTGAAAFGFTMSPTLTSGTNPIEWYGEGADFSAT